jgi:DNA-binding transcriptional regulator YbjK
MPPNKPPDMDDQQKEAVISFKNACETGDINAARQALPRALGKINLSEAFSAVAKRDDQAFMRTMVEEFKLDKNEALRQAVVKNRMPMVEYLLQQGVDPMFDNARDIKIAAFNGYIEVFRKLLDSVKCDNETLFILAKRAAENFQKEILAEVLDRRLDMHWQNERLLREMAANNRPQPDALSYLIDRGADIHVMGEAPLAESIQHMRIKNIPVLLDAGADPLMISDEARLDMEDLHLSVLIQLKGAEKRLRDLAEETVLKMQMPADLEKEHGPQKMTGMMLVVRAEGVKSFVYKVMTEHPEWASAVTADVLTKKHGNLSPLDLAIRTEQHQHLFTPALWINREDEMKKLWGHLPREIQKTMPWEETVRELRQYHAAQERQQKLLSRVSGLPRLRR